MKPCGRCNTINPDDSYFCSHCGARLGGAIGNELTVMRTEQGPEYVMVPKKSNKGKIAAVAVVVLILVVAIGGFSYTNYGNKAYITIEVKSEHWLLDVNVEFVIDGKTVMTYDGLGAYESYKHGEFEYEFGRSYTTKSITVEARSTGGGLGATSDSEVITVKDGGHYSVSLTV